MEARPGIFICTDAKGRKITSDRPIPECADREQREVNAAGAVKRVIPGQLSADERERADQRADAEAQRKAREMEQMRKDRALLARYPSQRQHDAERERQVSLVQGATSVVEKRGQELKREEKDILDELEFYRADPSKAPAWLKRKLADNAEQQSRQQQLLAQQLDEQKRVHARFDEELARLKTLWAARSAAADPGAPR